ncbi:MAG: hypothetical protein QM778_00425 [Myxococcales bacterium]
MTYDAESRITANNSKLDGSTSYTYDNTNQLTGADHPSGQTDESYTYDANGNRNNTGNQITDNNRLTFDGTYLYEYDGEGNMTARTNVNTRARTTYEWDYRNRLTAVNQLTAQPFEDDGFGTMWGWGEE